MSETPLVSAEDTWRNLMTTTPIEAMSVTALREHYRNSPLKTDKIAATRFTDEQLLEYRGHCFYIEKSRSMHWKLYKIAVVCTMLLMAAIGYGGLLAPSVTAYGLQQFFDTVVPLLAFAWFPVWWIFHHISADQFIGIFMFGPFALAIVGLVGAGLRRLLRR
jgi:hypothetical protein